MDSSSEEVDGNKKSLRVIACHGVPAVLTLAKAASISAILLLAVTSCEAGIHFHWSFAIVGALLAAMAITLGTLEQSMLLAWLIAVPLAIGGAVIYVVKARKSHHAA